MHVNATAQSRAASLYGSILPRSFDLNGDVEPATASSFVTSTWKCLTNTVTSSVACSIHFRVTSSSGAFTTLPEAVGYQNPVE